MNKPIYNLNKKIEIETIEKLKLIFLNILKYLLLRKNFNTNQSEGHIKKVFQLILCYQTTNFISKIHH